MTGRRLFWIVIILFFVVSYVTSSGVEMVVDYLWFSALGYPHVYTTTLTAEIVLGLVGMVVAFAILYPNFAFAVRQVGDPATFLPAELMVTPVGHLLSGKMLGRVALGISALVAVLSGLTLSAGWAKPLLYLKSTPFGDTDPIFLRDVGFYVFSLPFFDLAQSFLSSVAFIALLGVGGAYLLRLQAEKAAGPGVISLHGFPTKARVHVGLLGAFILLLMAVGLYLDRFEIMYRPGGLLTGPGYSDVYGTLPVLALKAATAVVVAGALVYALARERYRMLIGLAGLLVVVWVGGNLYTSLLQRFVVTPNELDKERPFLKYHIESTNKAFGLDKVQERPLLEDTSLTAKDIQANSATIHNIRLWDHEPLLDTFAQIQEIRTYYQFVSVDNDRYRINGELRQTMLSPRELSVDSLPSRTWINERLTFTHGYGVALGPVNQVNEQGLPVLFVKDLPPQTNIPALKITQPEIYYGELSNDYVFVKTAQKEFDYPQGDKNIFSSYDGTGGVSLTSLWSRLLFAFYLRDVKLLLSQDFTPETRIMFYRNIMERASRIAPFLTYDRDPYMVIDHGRLYWILDAYTRSSRYPYAQAAGSAGNYMRNPVKVVIDAKNGTVNYYLIEPNEPIAHSYAKIFPGLFHPISDMPAGLRAHLRHPVDFFDVQAVMYATYHMHDVNTFYNKEDQWSIPVVGNKRMQPYFTVMRLPEEKGEEFILMLPFTPRLKDNLAAWLAARMDGDHYGQMVVYTFPKQRLVFGPKQMVARINQDSLVSQQITLWDQSGSNVIRGTLLVIPVKSSLIYVQPLYLKAEDGRIPELKRVVVGYQDQIAMAPDLEHALNQVFGSGKPPPLTVGGVSLGSQAAAAAAPAAPSGRAPAGETLAGKAQRQYRALNDAARAGDWSRFGQELKKLGRTLDELSKGAR